MRSIGFFRESLNLVEILGRSSSIVRTIPAMRKGHGLRAGWCTLAMLASFVPALFGQALFGNALFVNALADDTTSGVGEIARPSVEDLAIPQPKPTETAGESEAREAMCLMVESAARAANLPLEFFARVIWQESRFQTDAVGAVTRSGHRAQGMPPFMPGPASGRRLR